MNTPIKEATIPTSAISVISNSSLETVTITSGGTIPYKAFYNCSSLESIIISDGVTRIGNNAFYECSSLESVTFENTEGWTAEGSNISSVYLADSETAARYLTSTYLKRDWTRS